MPVSVVYSETRLVVMYMYPLATFARCLKQCLFIHAGPVSNPHAPAKTIAVRKFTTTHGKPPLHVFHKHQRWKVHLKQPNPSGRVLFLCEVVTGVVHCDRWSSSAKGEREYHPTARLPQAKITSEQQDRARIYHQPHPNLCRCALSQ